MTFTSDLDLDTIKRARGNDHVDPWALHFYDVAYGDTPNGPRYQGVCRCGWRSQVRLHPKDASNLCESHDAAMYYARTGRWEE